MPCAEPRDPTVDIEELHHLQDAARILCGITREKLRQGAPLPSDLQSWMRYHLARDFRRARWGRNKWERDVALEYLARLYPPPKNPSTAMRAFFCSQCAWTLRPWLPANAAVANECPHCRAPLMWVSAAPADLDQIFRYL